jgi:hypothetical protein
MAEFGRNRARLRVQRAAVVNAERDRRLAAGVVFEGAAYQLRPEDLRRLAARAVRAAQAVAQGAAPGDYFWHGGREPFTWITADNAQVPLDAFQLLALAEAAEAQESAIVQAARALKDAPELPPDPAADGHWRPQPAAVPLAPPEMVPGQAGILAQLRLDFSYERDGLLDAWVIRRGSGRVTGDCEDFALVLAWRLAGRSWPRFLWHLLTLKSVIWHCTSTAGGGHAVLWHRGAGWADNMAPYWARRTPHRRRFPWLPPLLGLKLAAGPLFAWVSSTVKRAKAKDNGQ